MPTSVETFEQITRHQGLPALVDFLLQLEKTDLLAVRQKTKQLYREMNDWRSDHKQQLPRNRESHLFLAGLATYSKQEGLGRSFDLPWQFQLDNPKHEGRHHELFWTVVRHSRPTWLTAWFERVARNDSWRTAPYRLLRQLADEGLISYEPGLFAQSVAHWLNHHNRDQRGKAREYGQHVLRQLQADTVLLTRDLPQLFDFDTPADSAAIYRGNDQEAITWLTLLPQLVASGHLDRADLLTRCLLALRRDFRRPLLTWFKNLFVALKPTVAERLERQNELVELLAHPLPLVVNFALDQLKELWSEAGFNIETLLLYADGLMTRQDLKTGIKALLSGLGKALKAQPGQAPAVARLCATALGHADAAVQERAAKSLADILQTKKPALSAEEMGEVIGSLPFYTDLLGSAARTVLAPWLEQPAAIATANTAETYAPVVAFEPEISDATAIAPVADWHELLFLTGQALKQDNPLDVERWVDGLLRLRHQFPTGYAQQLRPYLRQVFPWQLNDLTDEQQDKALAAMKFNGERIGHQALLNALLVSWLNDFKRLRVPGVALTDQPHQSSDPLMWVEQRRLAAAEARLHAAAPALPLLSTPSHAPYWVAPTVLVQRLLAYQAAAQVPDAADFALALARTAVGATADAAAACQALPELHQPELRELLQWFLGPATAPLAVPLPTPATKPARKVLGELLGRLLTFKQSSAAPTVAPLAEALPWLWAVAARTRHPEAELPELHALGDYPGLATPWQPDWRFGTASHTYQQPWNKKEPVHVHTWQELQVETQHEGQRPPSPLLLYSVHARLRQKDNPHLWAIGSDLPVLLSLLPNAPASLHWHVLRTACRVNEGYSEERAMMHNLLESLLGAGPRFTAATAALLAVGLVHYAPLCRALALEVLLSAIAHRRLTPAPLGQALGRMLAAGFAPLQRLADGLAQARAIDATTDDALRQTLGTLLPELPAEPLRNVRKLLEAYADCLGRTRKAVPAPVQARLREWQAVASLKKVAASLLA
jgi:hypothetical protein